MLKIEIGEGEIRNAIAIALSESFGPEKKEALIRNVIRAHLEMKNPNANWGSRDQTILDAAVGDMLRKEAKDALIERLELMRPRIREIVRKHLGPQYEESLVAKFESAMKATIRIENVSLHVEMEKAE